MGARFLAVSISFLGAAWDYVKQYQVGIDYSSSRNSVDASYETARTTPLGEPCSEVNGDASKKRCRVSIEGGRSSGYGLFLQQAFKRQGTFYFKPDLGFGVRYLAGAAKLSEADAPLKSLNFSLLATIVSPYIQFGVTPLSPFPDVFMSVGPSVQVAAGTVSVNGEKEKVALLTSSGNLVGGFFEFEVVFWRFGDGALSIDYSSDVTGSGRGTKLYPKDIDGMSDFRANFSHEVDGQYLGFGLKLVTPWP